MLGADLVPPCHLRNNCARGKGFRNDPALLRLGPATPTPNTCPDFYSAARPRSVKYIVDHIYVNRSRQTDPHLQIYRSRRKVRSEDRLRCIVHFYRNVFSHVPSTRVREVSHMLKAIHAQESREAADNKAQAIVDDLRASKMGKAADLVEQAVHETLTYYGFPDIHWQKIRTNNPLERIMKEIGVEPASSVLSPTVSPASTWRPRD